MSIFGSSQIVEQLKETLRNAKTKLLEQADTINQLTEQPRIHAVVVSAKQDDDAPPNPDAFEEGVKVRIIASGRYNGDIIGKIGTIVHEIDYDGEVTVRFDDEQGGSGYFGVGKRGAKNSRLELQLLKSAGTATVVHGGQYLELLIPYGKQVRAGDTVALTTKTMQIIDVVEQISIGETTTVRQVIDESASEVDWQGASRVVVHGTSIGKLQKGDRVVLDSTGSVVVRNLGKEEERFNLEIETKVSWDDIGGLEEAKQQMIEVIEMPHRHPDLYRFYGKKPIKGVLLYGPPGCGKTMLAKATATALARIYNGGSTSHGFLYVKGPEILDRYVGTAEGLIRNIFRRARKHKEEHGYPAVIFIDEADAILGKRGMGISSDIERTIVPMFLAEMDGLEDSGAVVLLATNRPDVLDPAVVRDGRIDRKVKITRPTLESTADIFLLNLRNMPLNNGYTPQHVAELGAAELFSESRTLYEIQLNTENGPEQRRFTLANLTNGGMIANIVDQATSIAMHRDMTNGRPAGLKCDDVVQAIDGVFRQNLDLNHTDELTDFVGEYRDKVQSIRRLHQTA
jgi:proteasome-associated ATPase